MKSSLALIIGAAALLAGCGQPGPLYMPKQPAKPTKHSAPLEPPAIPEMPVTVPSSAVQY